ncbi:MAG TPA: PKD domain-containing protein [Nevskiaceae bacterium]|nr:PKD domain-containing protein [Nevskiaceae bacterium]
MFTRGRALLVSTVFMCALTATAATNIINTQIAAAAPACGVTDWDNADAVNIVYFGLGHDNQNAASYIAALKCFYSTNKSGHADSPTVKKDYTDVQKIMNYAGASTSVINSMDTTNTVMGTVYRDGRVVVDGKVVGTNAKVGARFSVAGATQIPGTNAYMRTTTSSFAKDSRKMLVHIKDGKMVFGVMTECGNVVTATPPTTPPKPPTPPTPPTTPKASLSCDQLVASFGKPNEQGEVTATFNAKATATNTTITGYTFTFGDNTADQTVTTGATTAQAGPHTYKPGTYTVTVTVKAGALSASGSHCKAVFTVVQPPETCANTPNKPECQPEQPKAHCTVPGKETLPPESPECNTPVTTADVELPNTGPGEFLGLFAGSGITGAAAHRIWRNRRRG